MVAVVCAPAVNKLAEILRAHVEAVDLVGNVHENLGAFTGLGILKGDGVIVVSVADVVKVLIHGLADVNYADFGADLLGNNDGVGFCTGRGAEAGERAGNDVGGRKAHLLDRHRADHDGEGGIHTAGDADDTAVEVGILHALDKAGNLDVQHAAAIGRELFSRFRKMGMHGVGAGEGSLLKVSAPAEAEIVRGGVEAVQRPAQGHHVLHVNFGNRKASRLFFGRKEFPVLRHQAEPREDTVCAALALAGSRQYHAAGKLPGLIAGVELGFLTGGDGFREGAQLNNQRGAGFRMTNRGGQKTLESCAHFHRNSQIGKRLMLKEHTAGHGNQTVTGEIDLIIAFGIRYGEVTVCDPLGGNESKNLAVIEGGGDVVDLRADSERQTDEGQKIIRAALFGDLDQGLSGTVKEDSVCKEIIAAASRKRKLREHQYLDTLLGRGADDLDHPLRVIVRIRDPNHGGSGGDLYKPVFHSMPPDQSRIRSAI